MRTTTAIFASRALNTRCSRGAPPRVSVAMRSRAQDRARTVSRPRTCSRRRINWSRLSIDLILARGRRRLAAGWGCARLIAAELVSVGVRFLDGTGGLSGAIFRLGGADRDRYEIICDRSISFM